MKSIHTDKTPDKSTQALADAEAQLANADSQFKKAGNGLFEALMKVCEMWAKTKQAFDQTPKDKRPQPTWSKYVPDVAKRQNNSFKKARMADYLIALKTDVEKVGLEKVKATAVDGSYRSVRAATDALLGKPKITLKADAAKHLRRALKEIETAKKELPVVAFPKCDAIETGIKALLSEVEQAQKKANATASQKPVMPTEWWERFEKLQAANDKGGIRKTADELFEFLKAGGAKGFEASVSFPPLQPGDPTSVMADEYFSVKAFVNRVLTCLASNKTKPAVAGSAPVAPKPKVKEQGQPATNGASPCFRLKTVTEVAQRFGSISGLARAAGKKHGHAYYWVKTNRLPSGIRDSILAALRKTGREFDLSQVPTTLN